MPELPEVENTVRDLKPLLVGRRVLGVQVLWPRMLADQSPEAFSAELVGRQIVNADRRGKYLLFLLDNGRTLVVHLRMTGQFHLVLPETAPDKHVHVVLDLDDGHQLRFRDTRKFGRFYLVDHPRTIVGKLGPEPLSETFTPLDLFAAIQGRRAAIKTVLLDQRIVAGLGNIYADEALFYAGIDPRRPAYTLTQADCNRLHTCIRQTLALAIRDGGSSIGKSMLTNYRRPIGVQGRFQERHKVYQMTGKPCSVCGTPIERIVLGQRSTHFCPTCQHLASITAAAAAV
jgi:formamidopyrimidine-DNA glycosylase